MREWVGRNGDLLSAPTGTGWIAGDFQAPALDFPATGSLQWATVGSQTAFTWVIFFRPHFSSAFTTDTMIFRRGVGSTATTPRCLLYWDGTSKSFTIFEDSRFTVLQSATVAFNAEQPLMLAFGMTGATPVTTSNCGFWVNGVPAATSVSLGTANSAVTQPYWLGSTAGGVARGAYDAIYGYNRWLTNAEVRALYNDPWQLWKPPVRQATFVGAPAPAVVVGPETFTPQVQRPPDRLRSGVEGYSASYAQPWIPTGASLPLAFQPSVYRPPERPRDRGYPTTTNLGWIRAGTGPSPSFQPLSFTPAVYKPPDRSRYGIEGYPGAWKTPWVQPQKPASPGVPIPLLVTWNQGTDDIRTRQHERVVAEILNCLIRNGQLPRTAVEVWELGYVPGDYLHWADVVDLPGTVAEALDRIAVALAALGQKP